MALSLTSSAALIVMSIDSEAKLISLIELIGCSRAKGTVLLIATFGLTLLPGIIINTVLLLVANLSPGQIIPNIRITWGSFAQLATAVLAFMVIISAVSLLMMKKGHIHNVK